MWALITFNYTTNRWKLKFCSAINGLVLRRYHPWIHEESDLPTTTTGWPWSAANRLEKNRVVSPNVVATPNKNHHIFLGGKQLNQWVFYLIFNKTHVYFCQITWGELRFLYGSNLGHQTRTAGHLEKMWETSSILVPSWKHAEKPSILGVYYYSYIYII